ncbi:MAG TPA: hypothetical protein VGM27_16950 [Acidobacteriaceae bacterium]
MVQRASRQNLAASRLDDQPYQHDGESLTSKPGTAGSAVASARANRISAITYVSVAILSGLGLLGKTSLLRSLLPFPPLVVELMIAIGLLLPLLWPLAIRFRKVVSVAFLIALAGVFLVIFPRIERMHSQGRGSDQPDCIIVVSHSLMGAQWPYQRAKLWSGNPLSCGPGWVALQAPAVQTAGYRWNLVLSWACAVAAMIAALGWSSTSALLSLIALSPGLWLAASNGSDFLTFGIAIAALFLASDKLRRIRSVSIIVLALVAQFRFPTMLVPAFMRKQIGRRGVIWASALAITCQSIFLFWNTKSFIDDGPLHLFYKLTHSSALSTSPWVIALEVILPLVFAISAVVAFEEHTRWRWSLLAFLLAVFLVPATLDMVSKYHLYGSIPRALEFWEGGVWICGCLPLAAAMLVMKRMVEAERTEADSNLHSTKEVACAR